MTTPSVNPYDPPLKAPVATTGWKTWSLFQSKTVRDICANMTRAEKSTVTRRAMLYGVWSAISVALPLQFIAIGFVSGNVNPLLAIAGGLPIVAHVVCIPIWQRRQRQFLCNTLWAVENGIQPDGLKLFN